MEITKVFVKKGNAFSIEIKIDNNIFKVTNQDQRTGGKWRKTPGQIIRDQERQQSYIDKKKAELEESRDVPLANEDINNDEAHKVILTRTSPSTMRKEIKTNTDTDMKESMEVPLASKDKQSNQTKKGSLTKTSQEPENMKSSTMNRCKVCNVTRCWLLSYMLTKSQMNQISIENQKQ